MQVPRHSVKRAPHYMPPELTVGLPEITRWLLFWTWHCNRSYFLSCANWEDLHRFFITVNWQDTKKCCSTHMPQQTLPSTAWNLRTCNSDKENISKHYKADTINCHGVRWNICIGHWWLPQNYVKVCNRHWWLSGYKIKVYNGHHWLSWHEVKGLQQIPATAMA